MCCSFRGLFKSLLKKNLVSRISCGVVRRQGLKIYTRQKGKDNDIVDKNTDKDLSQEWNDNH